MSLMLSRKRKTGTKYSTLSALLVHVEEIGSQRVEISQTESCKILHVLGLLYILKRSRFDVIQIHSLG